MQRIYFDNAATTSLDPEVLESMMPYLTVKFGNPSSIYSYGRETKLAIENARKSIAKIINAKPGEIFFTSCGTESSNTAISAAVNDLGCNTIISSRIEHHATLHSVEQFAKDKRVNLEFVALDEKGHVKEDSLRKLLKKADGRCLVSLMHGNNEIGNLLEVKNIAAICEEFDAVFHCDTVQTIGHYLINVKDFKVHFITSSAHKYHGPKGVGFLYINNEISIHPFLLGGGQERNMRAGTENIYGIVGLAKALELAMDRYEVDRQYIADLKSYMIARLKESFDNLHFNGDYDGSSLYTVLNVGFPKNDKTEILLFRLDMAGICASGGSACNSGANQGSHVINTVYPEIEMVPIRFSFCRDNTQEEVDRVIATIKDILTD